MTSNINSSNRDHLYNSGEIPHENCTANENTSAVLLARSVIRAVESLKNTEIDSAELIEFKAHIRSLASFCSKFLNDFQIEIADTPIENIDFESWCDYDLKSSMDFVVETFEELDRISGDNKSERSARCMNAILVLIRNVNLMIFTRFDEGLIVQKKELDELQSSNLVETSIQLVNGDDDYG